MTTQMKEKLSAPQAMLDVVKNATIPDGEQAIGFLATKFKNITVGMGYQGAIFDMARKLSESYQGGNWLYVSLDENTFFMLLDTDDAIKTTGMSCYDDYMLDNVLFSICVNLYVFSHLSFDPRFGALFGDKYHALYEWFYNMIDDLCEKAENDEEKEAIKAGSMAVTYIID